MKRINDQWEFTETFNEDFLQGKGTYELVRIPHNVKELPLHYVDIASYQMICGYRRHLHLVDIKERYFLQLDGAAHICTVYVNGKEIGTHYNGYTAYRIEITKYVHSGDNLIVLKLNTTEDPSIPPFGFVIDYLTYGGIYRDVWIDEVPNTYISDAFVKTKSSLSDIDVDITYDGPTETTNLLLKVFNENQQCVVERQYENCPSSISLQIPNPILWQVHHGYLYTLELQVGTYIKRTTFGLRTISLTENSLLVNEKTVFLRGLNRHQSFPYIGYAASESLQREDARILDEELGVNAVRTSHYPQSHYFIDECDKRGILVFTEIPGWQHVSKEPFWRETCVKNTEEMVLQYRNHPSICIWGVRVNESQDDDELYTKTNAIAHRLDPTRPTSGVRYLEKSSLLEDIYAYNDFSHNGTNPGCKPKKSVTTHLDKPLLISECNGHMFPTKTYDRSIQRQQHALRHAQVLNDAMKDQQHLGCFEWCMFDYATHKDFGSGDKICYHGVMDSFRNPKLAASIYASQQDQTPVLEVSSNMEIGDYPAGQLPQFYCFTNGDAIRLYKNDHFVKEFKNTPYKALKHGPILIDDTIGHLLEEQEKMSPTQAKQIAECLNAAALYGMANLPLKYKTLFAYVMMRYHMSFADGYDLYSKYVGNWGGESTKWRFDAIKDGKIIKSITKSPGNTLHLEAILSSSILQESDTYDMCAIRIQVKDENNNIAPYAQLPLTITTSDHLEVVGPKIIVCEGGMSGTYLKTNGMIGEGTVTIASPGLSSITLNIKVEGK